MSFDAIARVDGLESSELFGYCQHMHMRASEWILRNLIEHYDRGLGDRGEGDDVEQTPC